MALKMSEKTSSETHSQIAGARPSSSSEELNPQPVISATKAAKVFANRSSTEEKGQNTASSVEAPRFTPDFEEVKKIDAEIERDWKNVRYQVLAEAFGSSKRLPEVISKLDNRNASYRENADLLIHDPETGDKRVLPDTFKKLALLNQDYRQDVGLIVGESTLLKLEEERQKIEDLYPLADYKIPHDLF